MELEKTISIPIAIWIPIKANPNKRMHRTRYRAPVMLDVGIEEKEQ